MATLNVFITGATSGIGLGIAKTIAAAGHHIGFNGLADGDVIEAITAELKSLGAGSVHYFDADLRDGMATRKMIADAEKSMGQIDVLINNAGIQHVAPLKISRSQNGMR